MSCTTQGKGKESQNVTGEEDKSQLGSLEKKQESESATLNIQSLQRCSPSVNNILNKPVLEWTDEELQRAVDSVHNSVYGPNGCYAGKGGANPFSLFVTTKGTVILANRGQYPSRSEPKMTEIFGEGNYILVDGSKSSNYKVPEGANFKEGELVWHAETRGIQRIKKIGESPKGAREFCSHLSCESCTEIMKYEEVIQVTPSVPEGTPKTKRSRYKREYSKDLF